MTPAQTPRAEAGTSEAYAGHIYADFLWKGWGWTKFWCGIRTKHRLSKDIETRDGQYKTCDCGYHRWWFYSKEPDFA